MNEAIDMAQNRPLCRLTTEFGTMHSDTDFHLCGSSRGSLRSYSRREPQESVENTRRREDRKGTVLTAIETKIFRKTIAAVRRDKKSIRRIAENRGLNRISVKVVSDEFNYWPRLTGDMKHKRYTGPLTRLVVAKTKTRSSQNSTWLVTSRLDMTRHVRRIKGVVRSASSRACSNMADDEEAVVLACTSLVFCALDLHQSHQQLLEKVRWTCPPQSTLSINTCRASRACRACRDERAVPCCPTSATRLDTSRHDCSPIP